jgi:hypothetical protein
LWMKSASENFCRPKTEPMMYPFYLGRLSHKFRVDNMRELFRVLAGHNPNPDQDVNR